MGKVKEIFTSPIGRIVQGDVWDGSDTDNQGNARVIKSGPNAGQPTRQWFVALAIAKNDPSWPAFWAIFDRVARMEWPQFFPDPNGGCARQDFAFKYIDGDSSQMNQNGKVWNTIEGFPGHHIIRFSSNYAPKVCIPLKDNPVVSADWRTLDPANPLDKALCKRGYYVRIQGDVSGNDNPQRPGLYVNLNMVEVRYQGQEIVSGPDAASAFAGAAPAFVPAGATPLGPVATMPAAGAVPFTPAAPNAAPAPAYTAPTAAPAPVATPYQAAGSPAPATPAEVQPYTGFMQPGAAVAGAAPAPAPYAPAASPSPVAAPAAPGASTIASPTKVMLPAAQGIPYEAYIAQGWTDAQLVANGLLQA